MKILKIVLISFVALVVLVFIGLFIFLKTFDVMKYKPMIVEQAKAALGRDLDFAKASLGLSFKGIALNLSELSLSEYPKFGADKFLTVKNVSLGLDLAALLQKKISVPSVAIGSARVTIIREKDGTINAATIAQPKEISRPQEQQSGKIEPSPFISVAYAQQGPAPAPLPEINIASIKLVDSTVVYIDRMFQPPLSLEVTDIDVNVTGFSLTKEFPFTVAASALSQKQNIKIQGNARLDLANNAVTVSELKASSDLAELALDQLPQALPMLKGTALPTGLKGELQISLPKLVAGATGLNGLNADITLSGGQVEMKELASPLKDIRISANATEKNITLNSAALSAGSGTVQASGAIQDYLAKQSFELSVDVKEVKVQELINQQQAPVKAEGVAAGKIQIKGEGFTPEALKSSLSGSADLSFLKGMLRDLNVLRAVLDKVSVLPGLSQQIEAGLSEKYKQKFTAKDTALSDIKLPVAVENGRFIFRDAVFGADEFIFRGNGEAGLDGGYSVEGTFLVPEELSAAMAGRVPQLQYLLNEQKQIYLPLKISGKGGTPDFKVDTDYIAKRLLVEQGSKQLFKALDKAFGSSGQEQSEGQSAAESENATQTQQPQSDKEAVKDAVKGLLGDIFGQ